MPVPSLCLGCPRAIEITSRAGTPGVFMRVIGEHLPECSQTAYAMQQPLDDDLKEWFASAFRIGLTSDEVLDFFDCYLDLKNQRTGHVYTRDSYSKSAIRPILLDPPVPQQYREWCVEHWAQRMENARFYPTTVALRNIQQAVKRAGRVHTDDGVATYSMLRTESGVDSGDESLITGRKKLTDQRVIYWREQHCECASVKGATGKVCTNGPACTPFTAILQEQWQRDFARKNRHLLRTLFLDETHGVCERDTNCDSVFKHYSMFFFSFSFPYLTRVRPRCARFDMA